MGDQLSDDRQRGRFGRHLAGDFHSPTAKATCEHGRTAASVAGARGDQPGRDVLRRRRRQGYAGQWLPTPFETENNDEILAIFDFATREHTINAGADSPSARYEMLESVSFAFMLALELLRPSQRAVLLLRDVFDLSVAETARVLRIAEQNVKTTHHRTRRVMREYEEKRFVPRKSLVEKTRRVVSQLMEFLTNRDTEGAARLLTANVSSLSDGGGEFFAAKIPVVGRAKVAMFLTNLTKTASGWNTRTKLVELNGLLGFAIERDDPPRGYTPKMAILFEPSREILIERIYIVMASRKLTALPKITQV